MFSVNMYSFRSCSSHFKKMDFFVVGDAMFLGDSGGLHISASRAAPSDPCSPDSEGL